MAASSPPDRLVWLRGGLCVPIEPYLLVLRLESQGFTFRLAADGVPEVAPFDHLTRDDLAALRRWRYHVVMLIRYTPDDSHLFYDTPAVTAPMTRVS